MSLSVHDANLRVFVESLFAVIRDWPGRFDDFDSRCRPCRAAAQTFTDKVLETLHGCLVQVYARAGHSRGVGIRTVTSLVESGAHRTAWGTVPVQLEFHEGASKGLRTQ